MARVGSAGSVPRGALAGSGGCCRLLGLRSRGDSYSRYPVGRPGARDEGLAGAEDADGGGGIPHEDVCKVTGESTQRSAGVVLLQDHGAISRPGSEEIDLSRFAEAVVEDLQRGCGEKVFV